MAVGALVLSLTASALSGVARAAPSMEEGHDCSTLAHERNDAKHTLQDAWKGFRAELKQLSREARDLDREAKKSKSASTMTTEARAALDGANAELSEIRAAAHEEIQELTELGQACFEEREIVEENPHITLATVTKNEDGEVTLVVQFNEAVECTGDCEDLFSYKASEDQTTGAQAEDFDLDEDGKTAKVTFKLNAEDATEDEEVVVDTATDELVFTAGALADVDGNAVESETENPVDVSIDTNDLVMKYREVVDQAIKDMQAVIDEITAAFAEMAEAAETAETLDDSTVTEKVAKEKEERVKDKEQRVKEKVERVKEVKEKKSNANGNKGKGKGRG
jgi:hypothetical protein